VPKAISKLELEEIHARGGKVETLAKIISVPGLEVIAKHFQELKAEQAAAHQKMGDAKLAKLDKLIKAIQGSKIDLGAIVKMISEIQKEHGIMKAQLENRVEGKEPCEYLLTFERDRRGLIDGTKGIRFTPAGDNSG